MAEWEVPRAGMFMWMKLGAGVRDADEVLDLLKQHKVVVVPGALLVPLTAASCAAWYC